MTTTQNDVMNCFDRQIYTHLVCLLKEIFLLILSLVKLFKTQVCKIVSFLKYFWWSKVNILVAFSKLPSLCSRSISRGLKEMKKFQTKAQEPQSAAVLVPFDLVHLQTVKYFCKHATKTEKAAHKVFSFLVLLSFYVSHETL